ncbi:MAG: hypothetical protein JO213_18230 [Alphaproteobacteria bacterium]|nr:hypothetical protein [Alphaproteobacteria bacterium]MBV9586815.1 hypothetical protein [Alphaproteobacteria bacterium]MBV9966094.1 hypothetical protein [Alphaproteobacteria bacterium]
MSEAPTLDVPKLNEQEMQQLQVLLFRYLTHKSGGFADIVTDKLVNRCHTTAAAEPPSAGAAPPPPVEAPKRKAKAAPAPAS